MGFRHVLVPTDFGEVSRHALEVALDLACDFGATLTLVHAYDMPTQAYGPVAHVALLSNVCESARSLLDEALETARARVPDAHAILRSGTPWREILGAIEETRADLVVMGTHGRTGFERVLLGSVAEKIVRTSPVPVLTIRGDDRAQVDRSPRDAAAL